MVQSNTTKGELKLPIDNYPNSWPSVTTWHCSNTCITNWNSHYIRLLGVLHSTASHSGQGKDLRVGKLTHPENTTHTQCYSNHLLVLHNTCHCLPIHHQICTTLSHWQISPELFHAAKVLVTTHFSAWKTRGRVLWAADVKWPLSLLTLSNNLSVRWTPPKTWHLTIHEGECCQRIFESGSLTSSHSPAH